MQVEYFVWIMMNVLMIQNVHKDVKIELEGIVAIHALKDMSNIIIIINVLMKMSV